MLETGGVAAGFEQRQMALQIGLLIGEGVVDTVAHPGLRREMDDPLDAAVPDQRLDVIGVRDVHFDEAETLQVLKIGEPGMLQRRIIIIVQIVDPDHRFAARDQPRRNRMADETGGTGHENGRIMGVWHGGFHQYQLPCL